MPQTIAALTDQDVAAIQAIRAPYCKAAIDRDWDAFLSLYTDDCVSMGPNEPAVQRADFHAWLDAFPTIKAFDFEFSTIDGRGDLATAWGPFTMTVETEDGEAEMKGKFVDVFRKQPDDRWLLQIVCWNTDHP